MSNLGDALKSKTPRTTSLLSEALSVRTENRNQEQSQQSKQDQLSKSKSSPDDVFPLVMDDILFPMTLDEFIKDVNSVIIENKNADGKTIISRTITRSSSEIIQIKWAMGTRNGSINCSHLEKIEHRQYRGDVSQFCIFGAGGRLYTSKDSITFNMKSGERYDLEQWSSWKQEQIYG